MTDREGCDETCEESPPSLCDGDTTNNEWYTQGVCLLDQMSKAQVVYTLEHNPKARDDLPKITSCQELLEMLRDVPLLPTTQEDDQDQSRFNQGDCLPFYTVYGGNIVNR